MEIRPPNLDHLRNWKKVKMVLVSYLESLHFSFIHSFPVLRIRTEKKKNNPTQPNDNYNQNQPTKQKPSNIWPFFVPLRECRENGTTLGKFCFCKMNQRDGSRQA